MCIYFYDAFIVKKIIKMVFLFSVNTYLYNPMMLFMINIYVFITMTPFMVKMVFLFSVNAYVDIPDAFYD